jgi:thiol-disulfide isomerase/thioredoxin
MKKGVWISLAIVLAAAAGFFVQRQMRMGTTPQGTAAVSAPAAKPAESDAPSAPADATAEPAVSQAKVPDTLPAVELADRDGKKRKFSEWSGRPLMVNFWATWCAPCRREIPLLNKVHKQRAAQKLEIVGVAVDFREDVLKFAKDTMPISYPLLIGEDDGLAAVTALGMQPQFPFTVFADSKQRIVAVKIGELHPEEIDLMLDKVLAVDAGKLELPAARLQISEGLKEIATKRAAQEAKSPKLAAN